MTILIDSPSVEEPCRLMTGGSNGFFGSGAVSEASSEAHERGEVLGLVVVLVLGG